MSPADTAITGHHVARGSVVQLPARLVELHRPTLVNLLVLGGTSAARESVARTFHADSRLRGGPFVALRAGMDSAALVSGLLAQLGLAPHRRPGADAFRASEGGTLFLDEIDCLSLDVQRLLVEFLAHGRSLGPDDCGWAGRLATGSARHLESRVACGRFHRSLLDALDKIRIELGPVQ